MTKKEDPPPRPKVMVVSTIYGYEDQLEQICSTLEAYGYEVLNSHIKTIPVHPGKSNVDNCLSSVKNCDLIFGIIRPNYGSGIIGPKSITHMEILEAIKINKPRWFIAHRDIKVAREVLKQFMYTKNGKIDAEFKFKKTPIIDDIRVIHLYNDVILNEVPAKKRVGHWVDHYSGLGDILKFIDTQFKDIKRIETIIEQMIVKKS